MNVYEFLGLPCSRMTTMQNVGSWEWRLLFRRVRGVAGLNSNNQPSNALNTVIFQSIHCRNITRWMMMKKGKCFKGNGKRHHQNQSIFFDGRLG